MDSIEIKANERRFFDHVNRRDKSAMGKWIDEYVADDFVNHSLPLDVPPDKEGLKEMFQQLLQLFPKMHITIKEMVFENDILCFRHFVHGLGSGKPVMSIAMIRYQDGQITDRWVTTEAM
jgi:predicted SnoaL-like aldol condensation-catalyzing enzyme